MEKAAALYPVSRIEIEYFIMYYDTTLLFECRR